MKKIIIVLIIFFLCGDVLLSQDLTTVKKNKNFFEIDVSGGFLLPVMKLRGGNGIEGFWNFENYGMSSGIGTMINTKMSVYTTKMSQLKIYLLMGYSHFSTEDNAAYQVGVAYYGWPQKTGVLGTPFSPKPTNGTSYLRLNMPSLAFGLEYSVFTDRKCTSAFNFGGDLSFHLITGRVFETVNFAGETFNTINSSIREGFGINVAYSYKFDNYVGFHVGTRFTMPNIIGKSSEITDDPGYISLLDKENAILNPLLASGRTMGYFNFFGGMSFYIGKR